MSRCLPYLLAAFLVATSLVVPFAQAQGTLVPAFSLQSQPSAIEVFPNSSASFEIVVGNPAAIPRNATMALPPQLPAGWTYAFQRDSFDVPAQGTNTTRLTIFVGDSPPGRVTIAYEVRDDLSPATRANVTITVKQPPPAREPGAPVEQPPPNVTFTVSSGDRGESGATLRGTVTIQNHEPARSASVQVTPVASGAWSPYVRDADRYRVLSPGDSVTLPVFVEVPPLAADQTKDLDITIATEGVTYTARWTVTGLAPPPAASDPEAQPAPVTPTSGSGSGTRPAARVPGPNLDMLVDPLELNVPSGGSERATVRLHNTGDVPLTLLLSGTPPQQWSAFAFQPGSAITLAPGERADVDVTVQAPDVPPGGQATGRITAVDDRLVRYASFVIRVTPAAPRDATEAATISAPSTPDGGLPIETSSVLIVVGLAAVGSAAALVASRPLREKLLWGAAGLYTRLARPDVLGHEDREKLYRLVELQPGIHFHALQRDLGWNTGTLTYHVRVLEKHGFVVSRRDGLFRRFYLSGAAPRKEVFENQGPTGLRADVMEAVRNSPGISQSDLALGLGANKQTVNYHVKALERAGTIRVEKRGRDTYLYPSEPTATSSSGIARV